MLRAQLADDDNVLGRVDAARALGKKGDKDAIAALGKALREDAFWGVQAEAAKALGAIRSNAALDELLASTGVEHAKARRAVMRALGEFREERAAEALERVIDQGDASYYVEAAAAAAIGKTRSPRAFAALERALQKDSMNEIIRASAFEGFAELKDERAIDVCIEWTAYGKPGNVRGAATAALANLGEIAPEHRKEQVIDHLITLADDGWFRTQMSAIHALQELHATKALGALERVANTRPRRPHDPQRPRRDQVDPRERRQGRGDEEAARGGRQADGREPRPARPPGQDRGEAGVGPVDPGCSWRSLDLPVR